MTYNNIPQRPLTDTEQNKLKMVCQRFLGRYKALYRWAHDELPPSVQGEVRSALYRTLNDHLNGEGG